MDRNEDYYAIGTVEELVRLVRACGSKLESDRIGLGDIFGQARKSLWIETKMWFNCNPDSPVRLVRACGSKLNGTAAEVWEERVRLVRACGSKHTKRRGRQVKGVVRLVRACGSKPCDIFTKSWPLMVRLVRACGSKPMHSLPLYQKP